MAMDELDQLFKDSLHKDDVAAFLIEPVLGEGTVDYLFMLLLWLYKISYFELLILTTQ
jgi:hypothetical protein